MVFVVSSVKKRTTPFLNNHLLAALRLISVPLRGKKTKEYTPPPWHPSFLGLSPDPDVTEQKKAMVYTKGKGFCTIGPERRVFTIEPQTLKKKKRRVSTVVVYNFFFPALALRVNVTARTSSSERQVRPLSAALIEWLSRGNQRLRSLNVKKQL